MLPLVEDAAERGVNGALVVALLRQREDAKTFTIESHKLLGTQTGPASRALAAGFVSDTELPQES